jgi:hypothetical protein
VLDLVVCHGDFLNADHEYVHKNKNVKGFGIYGDIMIRDLSGVENGMENFCIYVLEARDAKVTYRVELKKTVSWPIGRRADSG